MSLRFLGVVAADQGDAERATDLLQQSVAVYRELEAGRQAVPRPPTDALQSTGSVPRIYATVNRYLPVWFGEAFMADPGFNRVLVARNWGDYGQAARLLEDLVAQALDLGDRRYATYARLFLGLLARDQGDYEQALTLYSESLAAFQDVEDAFGTAMALIGLSDVARDQGEAERVIAFAEESLGLVREIGDALFTGFCLHNLGLAARYQRDYERAEALFAESLALLRDPGISGAPATEVLSSVGLLALERGDYQQAEESFSEALQTSRKAGVRYVLGTLLDGMASVALGQGQTERAGRLFGAAESVRDRLGTPRWPANEALYQKYVTLTREALGEERFARIREEARPTTVDEAIAYARNDAPNAL
jgi:tetratricopeptide (TPR) repeat protein